MSNYAKIKYFDIANGEGIRTSLFFSGCNHHCKGCFNSELWDYNYGKPFTNDTYEEIKSSMSEHISGISILGGEPFDPLNVDTLCTLVKNFKRDFPDKTIWCWSGYAWDELTHRENQHLNDVTKDVFKHIDVLVDGRFIEEQKDLTLRFRGSTSQRIINVKESVLKGETILYEE